MHLVSQDTKYSRTGVAGPLTRMAGPFKETPNMYLVSQDKTRVVDALGGIQSVYLISRDDMCQYWTSMQVHTDNTSALLY